jgi:hypothetical protein
MRLSIREEKGLSDAHFPLVLGIGPCNVGLKLDRFCFPGVPGHYCRNVRGNFQ